MLRYCLLIRTLSGFVAREVFFVFTMSVSLVSRLHAMHARDAHGLHQDMVLLRVWCVLWCFGSLGLFWHRLPRRVDASFGPSFSVIAHLAFTCSFVFVLGLHFTSSLICVFFIRFVSTFQWRPIPRQSTSTSGSVSGFFPSHPTRPRTCRRCPASLWSFVIHSGTNLTSPAWSNEWQRFQWPWMKPTWLFTSRHQSFPFIDTIETHLVSFATHHARGPSCFFVSTRRGVCWMSWVGWSWIVGCSS